MTTDKEIEAVARDRWIEEAERLLQKISAPTTRAPAVITLSLALRMAHMLGVDAGITEERERCANVAETVKYGEPERQSGVTFRMHVAAAIRGT